MGGRWVTAILSECQALVTASSCAEFRADRPPTRLATSCGPSRRSRLTAMAERYPLAQFARPTLTRPAFLAPQYWAAVP